MRVREHTLRAREDRLCDARRIHRGCRLSVDRCELRGGGPDLDAVARWKLPSHAGAPPQRRYPLLQRYHGGAAERGSPAQRARTRGRASEVVAREITRHSREWVTSTARRLFRESNPDGDRRGLPAGRRVPRLSLLGAPADGGEVREPHGDRVRVDPEGRLHLDDPLRIRAGGADRQGTEGDAPAGAFSRVHGGLQEIRAEEDRRQYEDGGVRRAGSHVAHPDVRRGAHLRRCEAPDVVEDVERPTGPDGDLSPSGARCEQDVAGLRRDGGRPYLRAIAARGAAKRVTRALREPDPRHPEEHRGGRGQVQSRRLSRATHARPKDGGDSFSPPLPTPWRPINSAKPEPRAVRERVAAAARS